MAQIIILKRDLVALGKELELSGTALSEFVEKGVKEHQEKEKLDREERERKESLEREEKDKERQHELLIKEKEWELREKEINSAREVHAASPLFPQTQEVPRYTQHSGNAICRGNIQRQG